MTALAAFRPTAITCDGERIEWIGQPTACPYLMVTPGRTSTGHLGPWVTLSHVPTGMTIPTPVGVTGEFVHEFAAAIAHLDWNFTDPHTLVNERSKRQIKEVGRILRRLMDEAEL